MPRPRITFAALALAVALALAPPASADFLVAVDPASLAGAADFNFDTPFFAGAGSGYYDAPAVVLSQPPGVTFGKSFPGQAVGSATVGGEHFDTLPAGSVGGLVPVAGGNDTNLYVGQPAVDSTKLRPGGVGAAVGSAFLAGTGPDGFPNYSAFGEGSLAAGFAAQAPAFGFSLVGTDGGPVTVTAYRANGTSLGSITLAAPGDGPVAFASSDALSDIAGFTVTNTDPGGIGIDHVRLPIAPVPEPAGVALMGIGVASVLPVLVRRKR